MDSNSAWLSVLFALIALLYASVGQAGASGYLAAMGLFGMAPAAMKVTALSLNLVVAAIGTTHFWRSGLLSWRTFYPFAILGFPFSLIGGAIQLRRMSTIRRSAPSCCCRPCRWYARRGARRRPKRPPLPIRRFSPRL